jgi:hypothetical protein
VNDEKLLYQIPILSKGTVEEDDVLSFFTNTDEKNCPATYTLEQADRTSLTEE